MQAIEHGAPVDLVFQSIAGTEKANTSFGISLAHSARSARGGALAAARHGGTNVMYFETGQGSALSAGAQHRGGSADLRSPRLRGGARVQAVTRQHRGRLHRPGVSVRRQADHPRRAGGPFLRQAARRADGLRRLLHQPRRSRSGRHGHVADLARRRPACNFIMGVPGADDVMLNYQSTSFPRCALPARRCWVSNPRRNSKRGWKRCKSPIH